MCGFWSGEWCENKKHFDINEKTSTEIEKLFPFLEDITWSGGEVFLSKHFERLFDKASKYPNLSQTILTNGLLINEKWAKKITKNKVTLIYSIDGATKEIYEKIRQGAKFNELIKRIRLINRYIKRNKSETKKIIHFTVMRTNYKEMEKMVDFAKKYKFSRIDFFPILGADKVFLIQG